MREPVGLLRMVLIEQAGRPLVNEGSAWDG
jgi:hypothetical protein